MLGENNFFLTELKKGQKAIIISILWGRMAIKRLADLGLTPKTQIKISRKALFGPIEVEFKGSRLVLGRRLASKILVKLI